MQIDDVTTVNKGFENDFHLSYQGKKFKIAYKDKGSWRDITLKALNQLLMPEYEIRFCIDSWGSDTLAFIPLTQNEVTILTEKFGKLFEQKLQRITANSQIFDLEL